MQLTASEQRELTATAHLRLNIGCGDFPLYFWTNLDADPKKPADVHTTVPPIPNEDESLAEIYAGHVLEHMDFETGQFFLQECFRCLKPGGKLGIVVPDTREIMRRYVAGAIDAVEYPWATWWRIADLDHVCHIFLYSTVQGSPHKWSYDEHTLARAMRQAGFVDLAPIDRFSDPRIAQGAWYQCGLDGYKSAVAS